MSAIESDLQQDKVLKDGAKVIANQPVSGFVRGARLLYYASTALMLAAIVLQIFFAGASLLVDSSFLEFHRGFAHVLELFAILLPILALIARQPWRITLLSLLPFFLIGMQYVYLWALTGMGLPLWTRGLHAVNAIVIYWVMLRLSRAAWQQWRVASR
jgi:hypothetical protein